ncbi:MAG: AraC family transcriptional regulator [Kiritimatiellaeota bacterium]|nr:AraC family transcriptional regulator [Kiritimatiellota bacterium]
MSIDAHDPMIILCETMKKLWVYDSPIDDVRPANAFAPFPKALPDIDGRLDQWLERASIVPLWSKEWKCRQGWQVGPRVLNDTIWYWFKNGGGWYCLDKADSRKLFRAGDLILIPQGREHTVELYHGQGVRLITAHFHAHIFNSINLLTLMGFPTLVPATANSPFGTASMTLAREYAVQAPGWKRSMADLIFNVLLYIIRHHEASFQPMGGAIHRDLPRLLPALEWLERQLGNSSLTVADLARKAGVSEVYLRRLFRRVTGIGPSAFIQRRRVERACTLLRLTSKSIKQIAAETGFTEPTFFYRVFGRWTSVTPAAYREGKRIFSRPSAALTKNDTL